MPNIKSLLLALITGALSLSVFAQEQIFVPECEICPEFTTPPYPHSGWWYNASESGTGINLDVQNGVVAGNLYAYKEDGSPIWYQFSGELEQVEDPNVYWTVTNDLYIFSGGQTLHGEYSEAEPEIVGTITVEFVRRNLLRFQVDDGPVRTMSSFMFGAGSDRYFEPESNIEAPSFVEGNPINTEARVAPWMIVQINPDGGTGPYDVASIFWRPHWSNTGSDPDTDSASSYSIDFWDYDAAPHAANSGWITCGTGEQLGESYAFLVSDSIFDEEHLCLMDVFVGNPDEEDRIYYIRVGDITDRNFIGVSEDGWVVKGFRLLYN